MAGGLGGAGDHQQDLARIGRSSADGPDLISTGKKMMRVHNSDVAADETMATSSTAPMSTPSPIPRREDVTGLTFAAGSYLTPGAWPGPGPGSHSTSPLPPGQLSTPHPPVHPVSPLTTLRLLFCHEYR